MPLVDVNAMLAAREERARLQKALLRRFSKPLICFTLNIPGPLKSDPEICRAFHRGVKLLRNRFTILHEALSLLDTGCEAIFVVEGDPVRLKIQCMAIEEADETGRLYDLDVLDNEGRKLDRPHPRTCLICCKPAHECARSRAHSIEELFRRCMDILRRDRQRDTARHIAQLAQRALLFEAAVGPKPGLVDRLDNGAHDDMDFFSFLRAVPVLSPYFEEAALIGMNNGPKDLFPLLAEAGMRGEEAMFRATGGVNTHKGAIFSMGLLCAATGKLYAAGKPFAPDPAFSLCGHMVEDAVKTHFEGLTPENAATVGDRLYLAHGITGVRGMAAAGFPAVTKVALPKLRRGLSMGLSLNDAACGTLLSLLCVVPDTVFIGRSSLSRWQALAAELSELLSEQPFPGPEQLDRLNQSFVSEGLSPGGCADLLALTLFAHFAETQGC
ncbi:MAG: citrate lyase holo-[acyl-carrier protein] synthase [Clostridiales bacterium]|nr:citrate lyase holo-[acyl-carrier protein] synthase [Bacillota bacterium]NLL54379.1 citrate lyase holo-[acyl-carrier protein] synthase [Clostridiales bacterium]